MKKLIISIICIGFITGCGLYGTTQYALQLDAQQINFKPTEELKQGSSCSFLLLGVIPWPWHKTKTPDTLLGAIKEANIKKIVWIDSTYDYKLTYAYSCRNVYGY